MGDERARSRLSRRSPAADGDHARDPGDGGSHSRRVRVEGAPVRLLVRRHPGGSARVPDLRVGESRDDRARAGGRHPRLVLRGGRVLDRGRARRGRGAGRSLAGRARRSTTSRRSSSTACRAVRRLGAEAWDVETSHFAERFQLFVIIALGESIVLIGATTADLDLDAARLTALGTRVRGHGGALVAVLRLRGADRATPARAGAEPHAARPRRLHVPPRGDDRRHHRVGGRRRARDRASDGRAARRRGRGARGRAGDLPARPRALPPADGRHAVVEAAGRRARVRRSGRARLGRAGSRALSPARRRARGRDRRGADRRSAKARTRRAVAARAAGIRAAGAASLLVEGGVVEARTARSWQS